MDSANVSREVEVGLPERATIFELAMTAPDEGNFHRELLHYANGARRE